MAKYKERWPNPSNPVVIGYYDNDTGKSIPQAPGNRDYKEYLEWAALGNIADPAYTPAEIAAYEAAHNKQGDINDARQSYGLNAMSVSEREAWLEDALDDTLTVAELKEAVFDALKQVVVYI